MTLDNAQPDRDGMRISHGGDVARAEAQVGTAAEKAVASVSVFLEEMIAGLDATIVLAVALHFGAREKARGVIEKKNGCYGDLARSFVIAS